jgi:hypothetical protein
MIKMIGRFIVILLVACLVAGGIYWLVQSNPTTFGLGGGFGERMRLGELEGFGSGDGAFSGGAPRRGFGDGNFDHHERGGVLDARTLGSIGRNLLIITLTTLAVLGIQKGYSLIQCRRSVKAVHP